MQTSMFRSGVAALAFAAFLAGTVAASAQAVNLKADLKGSNEIPPVTSSGTGALTATYDPASKRLTWRGTYSGLSGNVTAAHFHGATPPSPPAPNSAVVVPTPAGSSPFEGSATLTDAQATDLLAGRWYHNIHTAANPGGEIRGQVTK
jgi:CHRD domain-containing protein